MKKSKHSLLKWTELWIPVCRLYMHSTQYKQSTLSSECWRKFLMIREINICYRGKKIIYCLPISTYVAWWLLISISSFEAIKFQLNLSLSATWVSAYRQYWKISSLPHFPQSTILSQNFSEKAHLRFNILYTPDADEKLRFQLNIWNWELISSTWSCV